MIENEDIATSNNNEKKSCDREADTEVIDEGIKDARSCEKSDSICITEASTDDRADCKSERIADIESERDDIYSEFPELCGGDDLENPERYRILREAGATVREAILATNGDLLMRKRTEMRNRISKNHIRPVATVGTASGFTLTREQRECAREALGNDISDADIEKYWRRVT